MPKKTKNNPINSEYNNLNNCTLSDGAIGQLNLHKYFTPNISERHFSPSSLDFPIQNEIYRISRFSLPQNNQSIRDMMSSLSAIKMIESKDKKFLFEKNIIYLAYMGRINKPLPHNIKMSFSPKSSIGRIDVHVRVIADNNDIIDYIPANWTGELWAVITPYSFPIMLTAGEVLTQVRFEVGDDRLGKSDLLTYFKNKLFTDRKNKALNIDDVADKDGICKTRLYLDSKNVGYMSNSKNNILELNKIRGHDYEDYFYDRNIQDGKLLLEKDKFYILSTREIINIPGDICGEMIVSQYRFGEFRAHYAGFMDPGFSGFATLEIRPQEDIYVYDGYPIAEIIFKRLDKNVKVEYGAKSLVHYYKQIGPTLSKFFKKK